MPEDNGLAGHGLILVPQSPALRTIFWTNKATGYIKPVSLYFPHSLFCIFYHKHTDGKFQLKRCHVPFSATAFTGKDPEEKFFGLPLCNHEQAHAICFYEWPIADSLAMLARNVISQYWSSPYVEYNDHFSHWTKGYKTLSGIKAGEATFLEDWKENTKKQNYNWIMEQRMLQAPFVVSLSKLLDANKSQYAKCGVEVINIDKIEKIEKISIEGVKVPIKKIPTNLTKKILTKKKGKK